MNGGTTYTIDLKGKNGFDTYLRLEDATGRQLAFDDDSGGGLDARIVFTPPRNDTYRIIATTFAPNQPGEYTLIIRP
jgi:serralysin